MIHRHISLASETAVPTMGDRESWMKVIREEFDPRPNLGLASYAAFDAEWDDGAGRIADAILADKTLLLRKHAEEIERLRGLAQSAQQPAWHEAMADRVLQLKMGGAKHLSCDAVLGLIAFVRDGEGAVSDTSADREPKPMTAKERWCAANNISCDDPTVSDSSPVGDSK